LGTLKTKSGSPQTASCPTNQQPADIIKFVFILPLAHLLLINQLLVSLTSAASRLPTASATNMLLIRPFVRTAAAIAHSTVAAC
jgi:hypothetical protein